MPKPVIKIYLPHGDCDPVPLVAALNDLVGQDAIVVCPTPTLALPTSDVLVEIDLPSSDDTIEDATARAVGEALHRQRPDLRVQCKVYRFDTGQGFWSSS